MEEDQVRESDIAAAVIDAPMYRERCNILFELFQKSRQAKLDPIGILEVQEGLYACLDVFQSDRLLFKKNNDEIRQAIAKRLILITKQIMDSIVWRVCNYDRVIIQQLSSHPRTGSIDSTTLNDLQIARKIVEEDGNIALVNDLMDRSIRVLTI